MLLTRLSAPRMQQIGMHKQMQATTPITAKIIANGDGGGTKQPVTRTGNVILGLKVSDMSIGALLNSTNSSVVVVT